MSCSGYFCWWMWTGFSWALTASCQDDGAPPNCCCSSPEHYGYAYGQSDYTSCVTCATTSASPTTSEEPTTSEPTSAAPTTSEEPTTSAAPTTSEEPTTSEPTSAPPTTSAPTTSEPTSAPPSTTTTEAPTIGQCTYRCQDSHWRLIWSDCISGYICPVDPAFPEPDGECTEDDIYIAWCVRAISASECPRENCYWSCIDGVWTLVSPSVAYTGRSRCFEYSDGSCECFHPSRYYGESCTHGMQVLTNCVPKSTNDCAWRCTEVSPDIYQWVKIIDCTSGTCPQVPAGVNCFSSVEGRIVAYPCRYDLVSYCYSRCEQEWDPNTQSYMYFWQYTGNRCIYLEEVIPCDESTDRGVPIEITGLQVADCCKRLPDRKCIWLCIHTPYDEYEWILVAGPNCEDGHCEEPAYNCNACHELEQVRTNCRLSHDLTGRQFGNRTCVYQCVTRLDTGEYYVSIHATNCHGGYSCDSEWAYLIACSGKDPEGYWRYHEPEYEGSNIANIQTYYSTVPCSMLVEEDNDTGPTCVWFCNGSSWELIQGCLNPQYQCPEPDCECNASLADVYETVDCVLDAASTTAPPCYGRVCVWRCTGLLSWELVVDCDSPCECEPPESDCTFTNICQEIETLCGYTPPATTSSTTTSTTTTAAPSSNCSSYICRWYCRYDTTEGEFVWTNVQACPSGCTCVEPTTACDPLTACTYITQRCSGTTSTTPAPSGCGDCTYVCSDGIYILLSNACTDECYCLENLPCTEEGSVDSIPCYKPGTTGSTSSSTTTSTTTLVYSEGYCAYLCLSGNTLYRIEDNCVTPNICDEFLAFTCNAGETYFLPCSATGGYPITLSSGIDLEIDFNSLSVTIEPTTPSPDYILVSPIQLLYEILEVQLSLATTATLPNCFGICRYLCLDNRWYLLYSSCTCACQEPAVACIEDTEAEGSCVDASEVLPTLPPLGTTNWGTTPAYPTTSSTTTPSGYPHGYCKYRCTFYTYILEESTCTSGYTCEYVYEADCDPESVIYSECIEE